MPSPFPGMDPFIEDQKWPSFHHVLISQFARMLVAQLRPRYEVDPEERIYVEKMNDLPPVYRADVALTVAGPTTQSTSTAGTPALLELIPSTYWLPMPEEQHEAYLVIRKRGAREVVTVVDLLSPGNKRPGSDGRREYLEKRDDLLRSRSHFVEIDLLLGGQRLPTKRPLQSATDYCAFVCRANQRPRALVFEWPLARRLPVIPIPLAEGDPDTHLDLQAALNAVYDELGYEYSLDYAAPLSLPLRAADVEWVQRLAEQTAQNKH
ncbi:MAG: DUF4058 family protein [Pirellulaceae bacterium]|nr:DUF4058 family protein [Pirellulaceae bacterium]